MIGEKNKFFMYGKNKYKNFKSLCNIRKNKFKFDKIIMFINNLFSRYHPKSVLSLVFIAFLSVITPMVFGIFSSSFFINQLSKKKSLLIMEVVDVTRKGQELNSLVVDIERVTKQYFVLKSKVLLNLLNSYNKAYQSKLIYLCRLINLQDNINYKLLLKSSNSFINKLDFFQLTEIQQRDLIVLLEKMNFLTKKILERNKIWVDEQISHTNKIAKNIKKTLIIQIIFLISLTVFLIFIFISLIAYPINQLEKSILSLADRQSDEKISISGTKDLQLLGTRLEWLRKRLKELENNKIKFFRHMSHELKTPLANFKEGVSLLMEEIPGVLSSEQKDVIVILDNNSKELQRIIENLIDYNLSLMNSKLYLEELDIATLIQNRIHNFDLLAKSKQIKFNLFLPQGAFFVDKNKFIAIIDNLLSNAIYFSPDNGVILIKISVTNTNLNFIIQDQGMGINKSDGDKIFEPFYQGKSSKKGPLKGSGIGLSVVKEFVHAHNGEIKVLNSKQGACFCVDIPHKTKVLI